MYFWHIEKLKTEMAARPLSAREALPYLIVTVVLPSLMACIPLTNHNLWDWLGAIWSVLLVVFGTIYIYHQNGGANGQHFLQRYFAVGWVVAIRWIVVIVMVAFLYFALMVAFGVSTESTRWQSRYFNNSGKFLSAAYFPINS